MHACWSWPSASPKTKKVLAQDLTNAQIAERRYLSAETVRNHVSAIFGKLDGGGRHSARSGEWIEPPTKHDCAIAQVIPAHRLQGKPKKRPVLDRAFCAWRRL
jgi:hypothetical protein